MNDRNIEIHVSDYCNRNCSFCSFGKVKSSRKMSMQTAENIVKLYAPETITFSGGGEPTTNNNVLRYLIDTFTWNGSKCGLITNGYNTAENANPLDWVRLSVYNENCMREVENVLRTNVFSKNATFFYKGLRDAEKYIFLLDYFHDVTIKTLNDQRALTDEECQAISQMGFKFKQNPIKNDFETCIFDKPTIGVDGEVYKCCLCKAEGGFFGAEKCPVPCVMYNSNKQGKYIKNKYGFGV